MVTLSPREDVAQMVHFPSCAVSRPMPGAFLGARQGDLMASQTAGGNCNTVHTCLLHSFIHTHTERERHTFFCCRAWLLYGSCAPQVSWHQFSKQTLSDPDAADSCGVAQKQGRRTGAHHGHDMSRGDRARKATLTKQSKRECFRCPVLPW